MKHPVSRELFAYWDNLRGARAAPERGDIDPAAIRAILADTFILEVTGGMGGTEREFPIRLSGTRLSAFFLEEIKGKSLLSLWRPEFRGVMDEMLACVLDERSPMVAGVTAAPPDTSPVGLELLLLPLRHHGKTHTRILGSLAPTHVPSWLGLLPAERFSLLSFRKIEERWHATKDFAPIAHDLSRSPTRHGRFTVYEGGR